MGFPNINWWAEPDFWTIDWILTRAWFFVERCCFAPGFTKWSTTRFHNWPVKGTPPHNSDPFAQIFFVRTGYVSIIWKHHYMNKTRNHLKNLFEKSTGELIPGSHFGHFKNSPLKVLSINHYCIFWWLMVDGWFLTPLKNMPKSQIGWKDPKLGTLKFKYCWWKKSGTRYGKYPHYLHGFSTIQTVVVSDFWTINSIWVAITNAEAASLRSPPAAIFFKAGNCCATSTRAGPGSRPRCCFPAMTDSHGTICMSMNVRWFWWEIHGSVIYTICPMDP